MYYTYPLGTTLPQPYVSKYFDVICDVDKIHEDDLINTSSLKSSGTASSSVKLFFKP